LVIATFSVGASLLFVGLWNAFSIFPEMTCLLYLYWKVPALRKKVQAKTSENPFKSIWKGWTIYFNSKQIFLASFAYVLLFWTALSPGALISAYLLTHGINTLLIATYQGISSVVGMIPTFFTAHLFKKYGMERTGLWAIWAQDVSLVFAVMAFFVPNVIYFFDIVFSGRLTIETLLQVFFAEHEVAGNWGIWLFLFFLIISRIGLWTFDLAERQIMQEYVPEHSRGVINSVEYSLTNIFSLLSYGMGIVFFKPDQFGALVIISFTCVTVAAICYHMWTLRQSRPGTTLPDGLDEL